jgi:hypothetical protein
MSTNVNPFVASAHSIIRRERRMMGDSELAELLTELEPRLSPFNRLCAAREALRTGQKILDEEDEKEARANALAAANSDEQELVVKLEARLNGMLPDALRGDAA